MRGAALLLLGVALAARPAAAEALLEPPVISDIYQETRYEWVAKRLFEHLQARQFEALEQYFAHYQKTGETTAAGFDRLAVFENQTFGRKEALSDEVGAHIEAWVAAYPKSAYALLTRASFTYRRGWEARGNRWAYQVKPENWPSYREGLEGALKDVRAAEALDPAVPYAYGLEMAALLQSSGGLEELRALAVLTQAKSQTANDFPALQNYQLYSLTPRWGGSAEKALAFAREQGKLSKNPLLPLLIVMAHRDLSSGLDRAGKKAYYARTDVWPEVTQSYEKLAASFPHTAFFLTEYAEAAYDAGDMQLTGQALNRAWEADKYSSALYLAAGKIYASSKEDAMAETNYRQYMAFNPDDYLPYQQLAILRIRQKRYQEAVDMADEGLKRNPGRSFLWMERCRAQVKLAQFAQGVEDCGKSIAFDPAYKNAYRYRAEAHRGLGDAGAAAADQARYEQMDAAEKRHAADR